MQSVHQTKFNYSSLCDDDDDEANKEQNKLNLVYQKIHDKFIADIKQIGDDMIATISYDNYAKIWKLNLNQDNNNTSLSSSFHCIASFQINSRKQSVGFDYSKRFNQFAICSLDSCITFYKLCANNQWKQRNKKIQHKSSVIACNFFDKLKALCSIDMSGQLYIWSVNHLYCLRIISNQKISSYDFIKYNTQSVTFIKDWRVITVYNIFTNSLTEKYHNLQIRKMSLSKLNGQKVILTFCKHINIWSILKSGSQIQHLICISLNMVNTEIIGMNMYDDRYLIYATRVSAWIPHQTLYQSLIQFYDIHEEKEGSSYILHEGVNRTYFLQELNQSLSKQNIKRKLYCLTREDGTVSLISSSQLIPSLKS